MESGAAWTPNVAPKTVANRPPLHCSISVYHGFSVPSLVLIFFYEQSLALHRTRNLEDRPLSAFGECLFFRASTEIYES